MLMKRVFFIVCLVFLSTTLLLAQKDRYVFFLKDKTGTTFTLNEPLKFLSPAALERRIRNNIALIQNDLPVSPSYLQEIRNAGGRILFSSKWLNAALTEVDTAAFKKINKLPFITAFEKVAPGPIPTGQAGNDLPDRSQSRTEEALLQLSMLGIDAMHSDGLLGEGITIAVMDSGFPAVNTASGFSHLNLGGKIKDRYNFVNGINNVYGYDSHGTDVLSTLAAKSGESFSGSAPEANYLLYITEHVPTEFRVEEYNWLFAAERADSAGADIINTSLGYSRFDDASMNYTYQQMDGKTTVISRAATLAASKGILVVVSAGNEGNSYWKYITAPADCPDVIAVGSVDFKKTLSSFSSSGPTADGRIKPDLMALGSNAAVLFQGTTIATGSGTSFAAPMVVGLAAGVLQSRSNKSLVNLKDELLKSGDRYSKPDNLYGYGIPDYYKLRTITSIEKEASKGIYPNPVPAGGTVLWKTGQKLVDDFLTFSSTGNFLNLKGFWMAETQEWMIDVSMLTPGLYILLSREGDKMVRAKLLIQPNH